MTISILGARVIDPNSGLDQVTDLHLDGGRIVAIGAAPAGFSASRTIQADGLVAAPGLVDLGVSLREPGYSRKGNIASETRAAVVERCHQPVLPATDQAGAGHLGGSRTYS